MSNPIEYFYKEIFSTLASKASLFGWPDNLQEQDVKATYLNAMSNMTYKVECLLEGEYITLIAKKFGDGLLSQLLCRHKDNKVSTLMGDLGIGPKVLYFDDNFRFEKFIFSTPFTNEDMADKHMRRKLMHYVVNFHKIDVDFVPKVSLFDQIASGEFKLVELFQSALESKHELFTPDELEKLEKIKEIVSTDEISWLRSKIPQNQLIFSHNDFLNGNILKSQEGLINLIDYEYGCYNLRAFDLANFITESLFDYSKQEYPSFEYHPDRRDNEEAIKDLLTYYLLFSTAKYEISIEDAYELSHDDALAELMLLENFGGDMEQLNSELEKLQEEYNISLLLSHWIWLVWGIVVSKNPNINFGYVEFSHERLKDYQNLKNKIYNN